MRGVCKRLGHLCAGYSEAPSAEYPAHRMEGYSSALPIASAPAAQHHRYSGHHTPSNAYATPPPEPQLQAPPSAAAFPPDGARSPPPEQGFRRREPQGVPRRDMQQHDVHAGLPERQRPWSHDGEAMQRRPVSGGAARQAEGMGGEGAAGSLHRGLPAPTGHAGYGSAQEPAPQRAEPLDGKEFFRRCATAHFMGLHCPVSHSAEALRRLSLLGASFAALPSG